MLKKDPKVVIIPFCFRQFDANNKKSTYIEANLDDFQEKVNSLFSEEKLKPGYAPFCKHLFVKNFTSTRLDYAEITEKNRQFLNTAYEARTEKELPVLVRYFSFGGENLAKVAEFLDIILYSREQIDQENAAMGEKDPFSHIKYEWGVVSVKPCHTDSELPMDPITMMRNALGKEFGGSGVPLDQGKYKESVDFWSKYARIR